MEFRSKIQTTSHTTATFQGSETELVSEYKHAVIITDAFSLFHCIFKQLVEKRPPLSFEARKRLVASTLTSVLD